MALRLSQRGFGTVGEILHAPADLVMDMWAYADFTEAYEYTLNALNKKETAP